MAPNEPARMTLRDAEVLRGYLRLMAMSERALANAAGVGHATVNHLLTGRRTTCSARTAQAIESALACPRGLFFAPTGPRSRRLSSAPGR
jgi:hypothetical protein